MSPQERAERSASAMLSRDEASRQMGLTLTAVSPGHCTMEMTVAAEHANGHGICHGGFIFTLADTAFAVACNSYNARAVAQHNTITYLAPGQVGTTLVAHASEVSRLGRTGVFDVTVWDGETQIALFRGVCRQVEGQHFIEEE